MASRAQLRAAANERARIALAIMQREGLGIEAAAARVKTTRRNVRRFMKDMGITTRRSRRRGDRGKLLITRQPLQKVRDFIDDMNQGLSATAAAKRSHTTVRTMSKIMVKGEPLLVKVNNRWQLNVLIKHIYSLVYYGYLTGLGGKVQGGGEDHPEEHQYGEEDDEGLIESPDAPSIWWQIDFDYFTSTLPEELVGQFWKPAIMQWLREELEMPNIVATGMSMNFLGNSDVEADAVENDRIDDDGNMKLTQIEAWMNRYDMTMHPTVNFGLDDNHTPRDVDFEPVSAVRAGIPVSAEGRYQIIIRRDDEVYTYPKSGPKIMTFEYDLSDEVQ
mgnify:FL=1|tara:strand:+ start:7752 stop:8747 length:996 start_codon:yes stop_codon:yes gene_type:complete